MKENGTERAFTGECIKHFERGSYHCADCDELLFSSESKFNSGCGWPAFNAEDKDANITQLKDTSHGMIQ